MIIDEINEQQDFVYEFQNEEIHQGRSLSRDRFNVFRSSFLMHVSLELSGERNR